MNSDIEAAADQFLRNLKNAFPYAYISIASAGDRILASSASMPHFTASQQGGSACRYKSITTVQDEHGVVYYHIFLPVSSSYAVNIYTPTGAQCDVLTLAKMAESIIGYSNSIIEKEILYTSQRSVNMLLERLLLSENDETDADTYTSLLAADLGFDMSVRRTMLIVYFDEKCQEQAHRPSDAFFTTARKLSDELSSADGQNIIGFIKPNELIICHAGDTYISAPSFASYIKDVIGESFGYAVDAGFQCGSISDYAKCYRFIQSSLRFAGQTACSGDEAHLFYATDFLAEHIATTVPAAVMAHFYKKEINYASSAAWFTETLKALTENDMEINAAAKSLFLHRNTMIFRVNQIRRKLNLDPINNDSDRFRLIIFIKWYESTLQKQNAPGREIE